MDFFAMAAPDDTILHQQDEKRAEQTRAMLAAGVSQERSRAIRIKSSVEWLPHPFSLDPFVFER